MSQKNIIDAWQGAETASGGVLHKKYSEKFCKIYKKTPVPESQAWGLQLYWKKRLWQRCFPVNYRKFLRAPFIQNTSGRLLLKVSSTPFNFLFRILVLWAFSLKIRIQWKYCEMRNVKILNLTLFYFGTVSNFRWIKLNVAYEILL